MIFDQHKQTFYDKIAKTVVISYRSEKCYLNLNYVGITRRTIAYVIDHFIIMGTLLAFLSFAKMTLGLAEFKPLIVYSYICLFCLLSIIFEVFMIRRFGGTPGQLLCGIHIKGADTLNNITLMQAIIRHAPFEVIHFPILITRREIFNNYTSEWWLDPSSGLIFVGIILIFICAIFDRRKQFLHDKIVNTVAIDYKP
ncbi:RDD family protein [Wolbachia endosymbiont of Ctenocephalides felis wCfeJ]|uniref:RDD family protein n=1 Tax=Wolbachia endosymbiont of Ctenocephalides felis wCfeJ TaxID=2732594 RepID=UPI001FE7CDCA|nr:RDD family protein [Wolbachia endosymbiont of Ctenocephalides felis wCfeJ]WCR58498.1 MAG: hypothetical protein PG980_000970 [Wolbachia endosymbiont of Ctenocephalides felis wCfeJ]